MKLIKKLRHMIIAFFTGVLFHKFFTDSIKTFMDRPSAPGGEILFIPLTLLLVAVGWELHGLLIEAKKIELLKEPKQN